MEFTKEARQFSPEGSISLTIPKKVRVALGITKGCRVTVQVLKVEPALTEDTIVEAGQDAPVSD